MRQTTIIHVFIVIIRRRFVFVDVLVVDRTYETTLRSLSIYSTILLNMTHLSTVKTLVISFRNKTLPVLSISWNKSFPEFITIHLRCLHSTFFQYQAIWQIFSRSCRFFRWFPCIDKISKFFRQCSYYFCHYHIIIENYAKNFQWINLDLKSWNKSRHIIFLHFSHWKDFL